MCGIKSISIYFFTMFNKINALYGWMDKWFINLKWLLYRNNLSSLIAITGIVSPPRPEEGD